MSRGACQATAYGVIKSWKQLTRRVQNWEGVRQGCILSPCLFNLYAAYIKRNAGLEEAQAGIKVAGRNINNLRYADDITLVGFPGGSEVKASAWNVGDLGSTPGSGRSPGEGNATHSSTLAWRIPRREEPGRLQSTGSQRVRHD